MTVKNTDTQVLGTEMQIGELTKDFHDRGSKLGGV